jgi:hypothetical protein
LLFSQLIYRIVQSIRRRRREASVEEGSKKYLNITNSYSLNEAESQRPPLRGLFDERGSTREDDRSDREIKRRESVGWKLGRREELGSGQEDEGRRRREEGEGVGSSYGNYAGAF